MNRLQTIDADTLQSTAYEPVSFVVADLLPLGLHLLAGAPKIGKSWLAPPSGNLTPPRISPSCPHCLSLWLDSEYRSTVSSRDSLPKLLWAGWVPLGHLSRPSFMQSSPHRWVLAHPPHRCSPSSGAR